MTNPLATALAKMPTHQETAVAIQHALVEFPNIANQVKHAVLLDQMRRYGAAVDSRVIELAVDLWVAGR